MLTAAGLLAGCGGKADVPDSASGEAQTKKSQTEKSQTPAFDPNEPAEVVFYTQNGMPPAEFDKRYGDSLRKKFPHYTIKYIQNTGKGMDVAGVLAAGTRYDIYFANVGYFENETISHDVQFDMSGLVKTHNVDLNRFEPSTVSGVKASKYGIYALPVFTDTMAIQYNRDLFDRFGVPYPKDGMTWEQLFDLSRRLTRTEAGKPYVGYVPFTHYMLYMNPLSIPLIDEKTGEPTINRDERWKTFYETLLIAPSEVPGVRDYLKNHDVLDGFYKDQQVVMLGAITSFVANSRDDQLSKFDWDWVANPSLPNLPKIGGQPYTQYFGITKMARNKDAAMEVLKHLVSDEFQAAAAGKGFMPVLGSLDVRKAFGQETKYKDKNWNAYFYNKMAEVPYKSIHEIPIANLYVASMNRAMRGEIDQNTALRLSEEAAAKQLQEWGK
ncbi:extracellular solute-binding protein [Paenibacillus sp. GYB003]|uniref:extracellular solute-binding protein n=1 Tax=Paenibacillus sp. GYB003 TaxID=2994392 RepID=UPI002F968A4F